MFTLKGKLIITGVSTFLIMQSSKILYSAMTTAIDLLLIIIFIDRTNTN